MTSCLGSSRKKHNSNQISYPSEHIHRNESPPPPYSLFDEYQQWIKNDWREEVVEIKPSKKYGFVLSGGIGNSTLPVVITSIAHCSTSLPDNGRTNLRLFDRILSINGIDITQVTHGEAIRLFTSYENQPVRLHVRRLDPVCIEHIDILMPSGLSDQPLGFVITGGLDEDMDDPGLFVKSIDPNGLLASSIKGDQLRIGDRLLEIKTNHTSADLRWISRVQASQLIRRICQDDKRVTLVVAHRPLR